MTFRDAPPSPLGMITADCPWQSREAWEAAQAAQRSPSSNTGMILPSGPESAHAPAFVDYLKFTLRGLRRLVEKARRLDDDGRLDDSLSELRAVFAVDAVGGWDVTPAEQTRAGAMLDAIAQDAKGSTVREPLSESKLDRAMVVFARVLIQAHAPALVFGDLTGKGRDGYKNHAKIYTHLGQECGFIAVGGNAETVHVNLTGEACRRLDVPAYEVAGEDLAGLFRSDVLPRPAQAGLLAVVAEGDHHAAAGGAELDVLGGVAAAHLVAGEIAASPQPENGQGDHERFDRQEAPKQLAHAKILRPLSIPPRAAAATGLS